MTNQEKPITDVLIDHKERQSIHDFASMLETIAAKLKEDGQFTFVQGDKQTVVHPSDEVKVEYSYTKKGDKHSFEIEFDWYTGDSILKKMIIK